MSRLRADTMPAVTVPPRLNGLPIAITHSPRRSFSELPNFTALSGFSGFTLRTARSVLESFPIASASRLEPALKLTAEVIRKVTKTDPSHLKVKPERYEKHTLEFQYANRSTAFTC